MIKFSFYLVSGLLMATSAFAFTCLNDYSGTGGCSSNTSPAGDCATLGYSTKTSLNCKKYLYCPFDSSYKRCIESDKLIEKPIEPLPGDKLELEVSNCCDCLDNAGYTWKNNKCVLRCSTYTGTSNSNFKFDTCVQCETSDKNNRFSYYGNSTSDYRLYVCQDMGKLQAEELQLCICDAPITVEPNL